MREERYPALEAAIRKRKQAVVDAFRARRRAEEKARYLQRKEGIPSSPWATLTWKRLAEIESGDAAVLAQLVKDEGFRARQAELHRERDELEHELERAEESAYLSWIQTMPEAEARRREREVWERSQFARFGAADEQDLRRKNPAYWERVYRPQKERLLQAEAAAEQEATNA